MRIIVLLVALCICSIGISSAAQTELDFGRMVYIHEWDSQLATQSDINTSLDKCQYSNIDAVMIFIGSEYFETTRDSANFSDSRASWDMLNFTIEQAHDRGINVYVWMFINKVNSALRSEYVYFGNDYRIIDREGNLTGTDTSHRDDLAFTDYKDYKIGLFNFIASSYPKLDGLHLEEPYYITEPSYTTAMRARIIARTGLDPINDMSKSEGDAEVLNESEIVLYEFYRDLKQNITLNKDNSNLKLSANGPQENALNVGFNLTNVSDNYQFDWYAAQIYKDDVDDFRSKTELLDVYCPNIIHLPVVGISYDGIYPNTNMAFMDEIEAIPDYLSTGEGIFRYGLLEFNSSNGLSIKEQLHTVPSNYKPYSTDRIYFSQSKRIVNKVSIYNSNIFSQNTLTSFDLYVNDMVVVS